MMVLMRIYADSSSNSFISDCDSTSLLPHLSQFVLVIVMNVVLSMKNVLLMVNDSCELPFIEMELSDV